MTGAPDQPDAQPRPLTHRETMPIVLGVLVPVFMGSLDNTILATALPIIGRELGDVASLPWLIAAYLIAATAVTPLYGKVSDIHGRKAAFLIAIGLYMAGSLLCALAPNMLTLILGRILHGLGGGGLVATGMTVLGDVASPKDRPRYYGYFSAIYTSAGAAGPALGGFFAEHWHWSAIFWINIPMGIAALAVTLTLLDRLPRRERRHRLDWLGAVLIMGASVSFMLALNMGGVRFPWASPPILGLLAAALLIGAGFVVRLATAAEPLIPLDILGDPTARYAIIANTFGWGAIVSLYIFLPMYLQAVLGMSAVAAGSVLMVLLVTLNVSAGITSTAMPRVRHYKIIPTIGLLISIAGFSVLAATASTLTITGLVILLGTIGVGFGALPPLCATALQNTTASHQFGSAVAAMQFARNLISTLLIAVFGAIVLVASPQSGAVYSAAGFYQVFYALAACQAVALVAVALMAEKPLSPTHR